MDPFGVLLSVWVKFKMLAYRKRGIRVSLCKRYEASVLRAPGPVSNLSVMFVPTTGGLDVDAIPNEITTRIILNPSKNAILAQAINIGAKGVS